MATFKGFFVGKHSLHGTSGIHIYLEIVCPIGSMYGIFTYFYHKNQLNVGKYTIHGWYGC